MTRGGMSKVIGEPCKAATTPVSAWNRGRFWNGRIGTFKSQYVQVVSDGRHLKTTSHVPKTLASFVFRKAIWNLEKHPVVPVL